MGCTRLEKKVHMFVTYTHYVFERRYSFSFYCSSDRTVSFIIYNKPTRCNSGSIVFIKNYKYALHVSDALRVHPQEHYKL